MTSIELTEFSRLQEEILSIRFDVFVKEQGVDPSLEIDGRDSECLHAVATVVGGKAVGTGRLLPNGHIGRMAVLPAFRSHGVGSAILRALIEAAKNRGHRQIVLSSQVHAKHFYERFGFQAQGDPYFEAGIEHVHMHLKL
jgi:predicted GNAT family N-acyltransferase